MLILAVFYLLLMGCLAASKVVAPEAPEAPEKIAAP